MVDAAMELPVDLVRFLSSNSQLEYDETECEVGAVTLVPLEELKPQRFPVETSSYPFYAQDPNAPGVNSYLVLAVDLIGSCNDDYNPAGLLLWLPVEKQYACWDESHCTMELFPPETTWADIVQVPIRYLEGSLGGAVIPVDTEPLIPWLNHPYGDDQVYSPQPA